MQKSVLADGGVVITNHHGTFFFKRDDPDNMLNGSPVTEKMHRLSGPAAVWAVGSEWWIVDGQFDRDNAPAVVTNNKSGTELTWFRKGVRYNAHGPSSIKIHGGYTVCAWHHGDQFHRDGAPAVVYSNGGYEYWVMGTRTREDGPAVMHGNGRSEYWLHGVKYANKSDHAKALAYFKRKYGIA